MNRRRFRWWHGMTLGALVGVAAWQALALADGQRVPTKATGLSVRDFAQLVGRPGGAPADESRFGAATLADVRVHPIADGKQLVTATLGGDKYEQANGPVELVAAVPFVYQPPTPRPAPLPASPADIAARLFGGRPAPVAPPKPLPAETFASVRDFLARHAPSLPVTYLWWEDPTLRTSAAIGVPFALLGVLLPFALQCLVWLGLLAPLPPPEPKPAKFAPEPPPAPKVSVDDLVFANARLDALNVGMAQQLAARNDEDAPTDAPAAPSFEPQASSHPAPPLEPIVPEPHRDPTSFDAGVYYPVHRPKRGEA